MGFNRKIVVPDLGPEFYRLRRENHYRLGIALTNHCASAHAGQIDSACNACQEIIQKQTALQSGSKPNS